jgi:ubiquinone/menaquinone biosynthesis C-methylase UbiE
MPRWLLALGALAAGAVAVLYARRRSRPELAAAPAAEPEAGPNPVVEKLDPQPKDRVLQLGLGSDELTFALAEALTGGKLEVFDADQEAVDALAERARSRGLKNVSGWHGDPSALLFEDDRFDRALVLHDSDAAKREVERVLKPDGRYVATSAVPDDA